jgi:hypothetical protein
MTEKAECKHKWEEALLNYCDPPHVGRAIVLAWCVHCGTVRVRREIDKRT